MTARYINFNVNNFKNICKEREIDLFDHQLMILSQKCAKLLVIDLPERVMIKMIWILIGHVGEGSNELVSVLVFK